MKLVQNGEVLCSHIIRIEFMLEKAHLICFYFEEGSYEYSVHTNGYYLISTIDYFEGDFEIYE